MTRELLQEGGWVLETGMRGLGELEHMPIRLHLFEERPFDEYDAQEPDAFEWYQQTEGTDTGHYPGPYYPDPDDQPTFLLMLAQLARRIGHDPSGGVLWIPVLEEKNWDDDGFPISWYTIGWQLKTEDHYFIWWHEDQVPRPGDRFISPTNDRIQALLFAAVEVTRGATVVPRSK